MIVNGKQSRAVKGAYAVPGKRQRAVDWRQGISTRKGLPTCQYYYDPTTRILKIRYPAGHERTVGPL